MIWGKAWGGRSYDLGKMTLAELWKAYLTYPAIQLYMMLTVASAVMSYKVAHDQVSQIIWSCLSVLVVYPFAWYMIHRYILHGRWLYRMPWTAALWKRIHFDHHQDPHLLEVLFGAPYNTIPTMALITMPIGALIGGWSCALAAFAVSLVTTCVYEFFHCIQHLNYKPHSRFVQYLKRTHLLHHFHDEDGNYGIVSFFPDKLLRTYYPNAKSRKRSAHVFNLGYDLDEARRYPWVMNLTGTPPRDRPAGAPGTKTAETAQ